MKKIHNKLIRDNIPTIIQKNNKTCKIRTLEIEEYKQELKRKLIEESNEVNTSSTKEEILEEISDVLEVVEALMNVYDISKDEIIEVKDKKTLKNGKFDHKYYLEYVESEN